MARPLPPKPSLVNLKKQAKSLLKAQKENDPSCCDTLRLLRRFEGKSDEDMLAAAVGLQEAQHALAKDYGFVNWGELRRTVGAKPVSPEDRVKREGDKVWIEGVGRLRFAQGMDNQFMGALARVAESLDEEMSYDYLMGVSGAAFRLHFWVPQWCPSSTALTGGYDHSVPALAALGYKAEQYDCGWHEPEKVEPVRPIVNASIERGHPVVGTNLLGHGRYCVVAGHSV